jgi:hypothetical protein
MINTVRNFINNADTYQQMLHESNMTDSMEILLNMTQTFEQAVGPSNTTKRVVEVTVHLTQFV